jgi:hypothetical protein
MKGLDLEYLYLQIEVFILIEILRLRITPDIG